MVAEVMGGTTETKTVVYESKALIAACTGVSLRSGGLWWWDSDYSFVTSGFCRGLIAQLSGIINGCTNCMLTAMDQGGKSYD